jgi:hypothetical protein
MIYPTLILHILGTRYTYLVPDMCRMNAENHAYTLVEMKKIGHVANQQKIGRKSANIQQ